MTNIRYIEGDATTPHAEGPVIICHICNDKGDWDKGFAVAISSRWQQPEEDYRRWHEAGREEGFHLGAIRMVPVDDLLWVANMVAQRGIHRPNQRRPPVRYDALAECLGLLAEHAVERRASIHMPRIGCGLAGGQWSEVEPLVEDYLLARNIDVTVYDFADPPPGSQQSSSAPMQDGSSGEHYDSSNISEVDWSDQYFKSSVFSGFALDGTPVDSDFASCTFENVACNGGLFNTCNFVQCKFTNCTFRGSSFPDCIFVECTFDNCQFVQGGLGAEGSFDRAKFYGCTGDSVPG